MNSLLIMLGILLSITYCKAAILDYSNITPWRIAYAVYPVYEPESWVNVWKNERLPESWTRVWKNERSPESWINVWKNERSWDVFDNAILNVRFNDHHKNDNNNDNVNDSHENSQSEKPADNKSSKSQQSPTYPWPKNDKDWPKTVKKDHSSA